MKPVSNAEPFAGDPRRKEMKRVEVGDFYAALNIDGTITIGQRSPVPFGQFRIGEAMIPKLSREELADLLVALDGIQGEASDPESKTWSDQITREAMTLARNIYAWTASKATVEVTVSPDVYYSMASEHSPFTGSAAVDVQAGRLSFYDGSVTVRRRTP